MLRRFLTLAACCLGSLAFLSACSSLPEGASAPKLTITNLSLIKAAGNETKFLINYTLYHRSPSDLPMQSLQADVFLRDIKVASLHQDMNDLPVAPNSQQEFSLEVPINLTGQAGIDSFNNSSLLMLQGSCALNIVFTDDDVQKNFNPSASYQSLISFQNAQEVKQQLEIPTQDASVPSEPDIATESSEASADLEPTPSAKEVVPREQAVNAINAVNADSTETSPASASASTSASTSDAVSAPAPASTTVPRVEETNGLISDAYVSPTATTAAPLAPATSVAPSAPVKAASQEPEPTTSVAEVKAAPIEPVTPQAPSTAQQDSKLEAVAHSAPIAKSAPTKTKSATKRTKKKFKPEVKPYIPDEELAKQKAPAKPQAKTKAAPTKQETQAAPLKTESKAASTTKPDSGSLGQAVGSSAN